MINIKITPTCFGVNKLSLGSLHVVLAQVDRRTTQTHTHTHTHTHLNRNYVCGHIYQDFIKRHTTVLYFIILIIYNFS